MSHTKLGATGKGSPKVTINIDESAFQAPVVLGTFCYQGNSAQKMIVKEKKGVFSGVVLGNWDASTLDLENLDFTQFSECP